MANGKGWERYVGQVERSWLPGARSVKEGLQEMGALHAVLEVKCGWKRRKCHLTKDEGKEIANHMLAEWQEIPCGWREHGEDMGHKAGRTGSGRSSLPPFGVSSHLTLFPVQTHFPVFFSFPCSSSYSPFNTLLSPF